MDCRKKLSVQFSAKALASLGSSVLYYKKYSDKKTKWRKTKTFGIFLLSGVIAGHTLNVIDPMPTECLNTNIFSTDNKETKKL